jgi:hypothetical protein
MRRNVLLAAALAGAFAVSGCQCINDDNFTALRDAGFPPTDAGPPPPVFPLKVGDQLTVPQFGGNVDTCEGGASEGDCDRNVKADFLLTAVDRNDLGRWEIGADVVYTGLKDKIPATAIARLALENAAEFGTITTSSSVTARGARFTTDVPVALSRDAFGPNNFPFFQGENGTDGSDDGDDGTVFNEAAAEFADGIRGLDPGAEVETQIASGKMEAYFKDSENPVSLHKLLIQVHPMGFVCGWDEALIPFTGDDMPRAESSFQNVGKPLKASFFPPTLTRDGVTYQCSCFNRTCRNTDGQCLDPTDPDAPAGPCP